jgi:hypothetical protein
MEIMSSLDGEAANLKATPAELHISSGKRQASPSPAWIPRTSQPLSARSPEVFICSRLRSSRGAMSRVLHAMSRDETRPILKGVRLALSGTNLQLAATDGARLATVTSL